MADTGKRTALVEAIAVSLGLIVFAFFIPARFPVILPAFIALLLPAWLIGRNFNSPADYRRFTGEDIKMRLLVSLLAAGIVSGILLGFFYRWYLDLPIFPASFRSFVFIAALIGLIEELIFRGYIQGSLKKFNPVLPVLFSTTAHTAYKCCLFLSPFVSTHTEIGFLAFWTFLVGLIFGAIRQLSGSILPSVAAHVIFDIIVYGELANAPWWVW
jgi:membrane protease YdiL (CAAX protease family)